MDYSLFSFQSKVDFFSLVRSSLYHDQNFRNNGRVKDSLIYILLNVSHKHI